MALSRDSVKKAIEIFKQVDPGVSGHIKHYNPLIPDQTGRVYGVSPKADGGWEAVFIFVEGMTTYQWQRWNDLKQTVHNTPLKPEVGAQLTRIGFY